MFVATLMATVVVCLLLETYSSQGTVGLTPPPYGPSRVYLTVDYANKRLGNLLFNFASTLGIARMTNMTPIYGRDFALMKYFRLNVTLLDDIDNAMGISVGYDEYGRRACAYDPFVERLGTINTRLNGYYQSGTSGKTNTTCVRTSTSGLTFFPRHKNSCAWTHFRNGN